MGKDLHYSLFPFWERALNNHQNVDSWELINEDDYYFYKIKRVGSLSDITLLVSDEYRYIVDDYVNESDELGPGSMIYLIKPQSGYDISVVQLAKNDKITIGKLVEILGALNFQEHWNYESPLKREARENGKTTIL